ncbi:MULTISPECIES: flagellar hook-length control protein FliK [unclassified Bradyrhizobium]|uniref:flagellar hook-length control protein FliK n=1 Tax=unclassified Bradyrhizobium TaxID=2631580 RepID=UPI0028EEFB24|nr:MULTISPECIES: flagellar hook-length control protein FliK [unclassified Bradyrhizobium]
MVLSITPSPPVNGVRNVGTSTAGTALQSGTVLSARVQQVLAENLVQVAIGNLSMELASDLALQAGQTVQVAVTQSGQGLQLAIVGQGGAAAATNGAASTAATVIDVAVPLAPVVAPPADPLTGLERIAVAIATEEAATHQGGQGQLFADLATVASSPNLPPALRAAIAQVLGQQMPLAQSLSGEDVQKAFQNSGLFLETSLAAGVPVASGAAPDLKAALIVLRQTLASVLLTEGDVAPGASASVVTTPYGPATPQPAKAPAQLVQMPAPSLVPDPPEQAAQAASMSGRPPADGPASGNVLGATLASALAQAKPQSLNPGTVLALLQEAQQQVPRAAGSLPARSAAPSGRGGDVIVRTSTPPPPFRGNLPTPQPVSTPSLASEAPLSAIAHRLLDETDAALSRQTLLQIASLPDRTDASGAHADPLQPRWNFEIPFATGQGTAMAQFEISRDGSGASSDAPKRVWRARFSIDVEPAGPVHALISLVGERTSVRMWAERPVTSARLRAGLGELSQALARAELSPGDIVIQDGAPPPVAPPKAGHFLNRAS